MALSSIFLNPMLQSLQLTLNEADLRHQAIAVNIANVNTPAFHTMDVSQNFERAYTSALDTMQNGSSPSEMPEASLEEALQQGPARPDGNTVNLESQMVALAQNSARFEFANQELGANYHLIRYAITGQNPP